ncbi:MAG: GspE/PulE family protein [bacterium]|nr:GspE/PulE family protein [bacterium]
MSQYNIWKKLDEHIDKLVEKGLVTQERLDIAKEAQETNPTLSICDLLINAGLLDKQKLTDFIGEMLDAPVIDPMAIDIDPKVITYIPAYLARQYKLIPVKKEGTRLVVVMADPGNEVALSELQSTYPEEIEICLGLDEKISEAITKHYQTRNLLMPCPNKVEAVSYEMGEQPETDRGVSGEEVVNVVNNLINLALDEKASDIHLDPITVGSKIRYRVDGIMHELQTIEKSLHPLVVSRIKIMASLDISERRVPQDGRARIQVGNKVIDMRIATYPSMWGEKISIRVLTKDVNLNLDTLGLTQENQDAFQEIISQPHGLFLVTGPTGSGKTTTLYSAFMKINRLDKHAISIEDPIENEISGVNQGQVNVKAGITFATALRSMFRHDPDIILVGEIRDGETADITSRAAMTGHLVFSTLHTNSAVGTISRLTDLGLERFLIASSLIGIMAQRLVRKICPHCKESYEPNEDEKQQAGDAVQNFYQGRGCDNCLQTGYSGRTGIYELITVDEEMRRMIGDCLKESEMTDRLKEKGFKNMWDDGLLKVNKGITTMAEVLRVSRA